MFSIQIRIHSLETRRAILIDRGPHNARIVAKLDRQLRKMRATQE